MESQHPRILFRILTACLPAIVLSSACDAPEPTSSSAVVRDSAGIQIVENPDLPPEALTTWRVEPEPVVRIGMVEGPEAQLLSGVSGAARLSDGRVVVLDRTSQELRYFDSDGSHLETVGGRGDGPGEFQSATELRRIAGDTVLVRDSWLQRTSWFAPDGDLIHSGPGGDRGSARSHRERMSRRRSKLGREQNSAGACLSDRADLQGACHGAFSARDARFRSMRGGSRRGLSWCSDREQGPNRLAPT